MTRLFQDYEAELSDLQPEVSSKAVTIARELMERQQYSEEAAIREGIRRASEWYLNAQG